METSAYLRTLTTGLRGFTRAFPFEGNGNAIATGSLYSWWAVLFTRAFPFEGNGNTRLYLTIQVSSTGLHVPSRLKGMETCMRHTPLLHPLCLHVPSRLKGMETPPSLPTLLFEIQGLHVPSRLKGMETSPPNL